MASKLAQCVGWFVGLSLSLFRPLSAQAALEASGSPQPHLSGYGFCSTLWDPDGAGPLPHRLVVGGNRLLGGAQLLGTGLPSDQKVMTWDGSAWQALGTGPGNAYYVGVSVLISWNGELIAGGSFTTTGGADYIARWDGAEWQSLGSFPIPVVALAAWNGKLVAAGYTSVSGVTTPTVMTWDGVTWTALPLPPTLRAPETMISFEGELIVAGSVSSSSPAQGVLERWNGSSWAPSILAQNAISAVAVRTSLAVGGSDTLIVAGLFTSIGGAAVANIAKTNGAPAFTWSSVGGGLPNGCFSLLVQNSGLTNYTVVARTTSQLTPIMRYTTSSGTWTQLGGPWPSGSSAPIAFTSYAGSYHGVGAGAAGPACHRYDGSAWVPVLGPGIVGLVNAATESGSDMVIGGTFAKISGVAMNGIARWDGSTFTPLGTGVVGASVDALVTLDNGDIIAGGNFTAAGGVAASHIARWNGSTWSPMGSGFDGPVFALCKMPNGDVIAGGAFTMEIGAPVLSNHVARWNGTSWSPMHYGMNNDVLALTVRNDGTLFAGGRFTMASTFSRYYVTQWTGTLWGQVGTAFNNAVHGLAACPNGDIVAVGEFTQASLMPMDRIARWNGIAWTSMGAASGTPGAVRAVQALANGHVVAGRGFHEPTSQHDSGLSRWDGAAWNYFSYLTGFTTSVPVEVRTIVQRASGDVVLGGSFHVAGHAMAYGLASLRSYNMPVVVPFGTGCSSGAGPLVITADALPWLGTPFRTTTTGVAPLSLCLGVIGFSQVAIPLDTLFAEGQPGCSLLVSPDLLLVLQSGPGTAHSQFVLANAPSLLGATFFEQTIPLELDAAGPLLAVRGSNALAVTIGTM